MPSETPRAYRSELRARQARETRARVIAASARLFATHGYQSTTIAAIGRDAGVSTETVKTTASKAELLLAAFEVTFSGSEAADSLTDTEVGSGILEVADEEFLDAVVAQITTANARGHALWTVLLGAALSDPVVDHALQGILAHRRADLSRLVDELARRGLARDLPDRDAAAAAVSFLISPESYQQLVTQSGWSDDRYRAWLRTAILAEVGQRADQPPSMV
ncbi:TetR/AcrR family transcriptional regulator [Microbacterium sp. NPDC089695]|uniref:TetR/AcrR family transcriptional regulator n=1 Tax=Microbacterium sp. NPDC089695 TaxID=3364198 RepID=UPI0037F48B54